MLKIQRLGLKSKKAEFDEGPGDTLRKIDVDFVLGMLLGERMMDVFAA